MFNDVCLYSMTVVNSVTNTLPTIYTMYPPCRQYIMHGKMYFQLLRNVSTQVLTFEIYIAHEVQLLRNVSAQVLIFEIYIDEEVQLLRNVSAQVLIFEICIAHEVQLLRNVSAQVLIFEIYID